MLLTSKVAQAVKFCFGSTTLAVIKSCNTKLVNCRVNLRLIKTKLTMSAQLRRHLVRHTSEQTANKDMWMIFSYDVW